MGAIPLVLDREAYQVLRVLYTFLGDHCVERSLVSSPVLTAQFLDRVDRGPTGNAKFRRRGANLRYFLCQEYLCFARLA